MNARYAMTRPSGIETICVSAKAMRFAVMSPNHKAINCCFYVIEVWLAARVAFRPSASTRPSRSI
jgi:hypothetical protein